MFCSNCGNQIRDGAKFCGKCGTPVEEEPAPAPQPAEITPAPASHPAQQAAPQQTVAPQAPVFTPPTQQAPVFTPPTQQTAQQAPVFTPPTQQQAPRQTFQSTNTQPAPQPAQNNYTSPRTYDPYNPYGSSTEQQIKAKKAKPLYAILAALHIAQIVLWFQDFIRLSASAYGYKAEESGSIAFIWSEEISTDAVTYFYMAIFVIAIILALIPIFNKKLRRRRMIFSKITALLTLAMQIFVITAVNDNAGRVVNVNVTLLGWLYIAITLGIFFFTMYISHLTKQS